jgi:hypothetical protein
VAALTALFAALDSEYDTFDDAECDSLPLACDFCIPASDACESASVALVGAYDAARSYFEWDAYNTATDAHDSLFHENDATCDAYGAASAAYGAVVLLMLLLIGGRLFLLL